MNPRDWLRRSWLHPHYLAWKLRSSSRAREDLFTNFYADNVWASDESRSGSGSTLAATDELRRTLPDLLRALAVRSLLDIPCGDFTWMQAVDLDSVDYTGGDIVGALVSQLHAEFGRPGRRFVRLDVLTDPLPTVDAVLMRDLLLHLPNAAVERAIERVAASGATYLLASHYPATAANGEVAMGGHRFLNLSVAPFSLPSPIRVLSDADRDRPDKCLGVWRVADLTRPVAR